MSRSPWAQEYDGNGIIKYQFEGNHSFAFVDQNSMDLHKLPNGGARYNDKELNQLSINGSNIHISSSDATTTLYVGSIGLALTFVLIGFGVVETQERIHSVVVWYFTRHSNQKPIQNEKHGENAEIDKHE